MQNISASALTDYSPVQRGQKRNHQLEIGKNNTAFVNTCWYAVNYKSTDTFLKLRILSRLRDIVNIYKKYILY